MNGFAVSVTSLFSQCIQISHLEGKFHFYTVINVSCSNYMSFFTKVILGL